MRKRLLLLAAGTAFIWAGCGEQSGPLTPTGEGISRSPEPSFAINEGDGTDPAGFVCETIDFNVDGDGTGTRITEVMAAGTTMRVRVVPYLAPSTDHAMLYDTDPPIGADVDLESTADCPGCDGLAEILVIEHQDGAEAEGDSQGGGRIFLDNFDPPGTFQIVSFKAIDDDDGPFALVVDETETGRSSSLGNGSVEIITPSTQNFSEQARFFLGIASGPNAMPRLGKKASGGFDDIRFCAQCNGQLGDFVWEDLNSNGIQDPGEPGIPGVTVLLKDGVGSVLAMDVTDADGLYGFSGLCPGTYTVEVDVNQPALDGFLPTLPNQSGDPVTSPDDSNQNPFTNTYATNNFNDPTIDFGFVTPFVDCQECAGGLTELNLRYTGVLPVSITVDGDVAFLGGGTGPELVNPGDLIQLVAAPGKDKMKSDIKLFLDGDERKIHTSCSKPIGPGAVFGVFTVEYAVSKDGGVVCPLPPCGECKGGITRLELEYGGTGGIIEVKGEVEFIDGSTTNLVNNGDTFILIGSKEDGKFQSEIELKGPDGTTKIHTSCSQPIGPGSVFGPYTVVTAYSKDSPIEVCPLPPPPDCAECKGGVTELTLEYTGPDGMLVEVVDDKTTIFSQVLNAGDQFTLNGSKDDGKFMKNDLVLYVGGAQNATIHVSCSQPIGPNAVFGDFLVIQVFSKDNPGIEVCPVPPPPPPPPGGANLCETIGKPEKLVFRYDNTVGCTFSSSQDPSKLVCDDFGTALPLASSVQWKAGDKDKATETDADRFGSGTATSPPAVIGDYVIADALLNGDATLKSDTKIHLLDGGVAVRFVKMHSSCSQPIRLNDVYGGLELVGYVAEKGQGTAGIVP